MSREKIKNFIKDLLNSLDNSKFFLDNPSVAKKDIKKFLTYTLNSFNSPKLSESESYKLFTDGASRGNPGLSGAGFVLLDRNDNILLTGKKFLNIKTNNEAEYIALIFALEKIAEKSIKRVNIYLDSELVVKQLKGEYKVKNLRLQELYEKVKSLLEKFDFTINHVKRSENKIADKLANEAIDEYR